MAIRQDHWLCENQPTWSNLRRHPVLIIGEMGDELATPLAMALSKTLAYGSPMVVVDLGTGQRGSAFTEAIFPKTASSPVTCFRVSPLGVDSLMDQVRAALTRSGVNGDLLYFFSGIKSSAAVNVFQPFVDLPGHLEAAGVSVRLENYFTHRACENSQCFPLWGGMVDRFRFTQVVYPHMRDAYDPATRNGKKILHVVPTLWMEGVEISPWVSFFAQRFAQCELPILDPITFPFAVLQRIDRVLRLPSEWTPNMHHDMTERRFDLAMREAYENQCRRRS